MADSDEGSKAVPWPNLKTIRERGGKISQRDLDEKIGKKPGHVAQIETGKLLPPGRELSDAIDRAVGRPVGTTWQESAPDRLRRLDPDLVEWHEAQVAAAGRMPLRPAEEQLLQDIRLQQDAIEREVERRTTDLPEIRQQITFLRRTDLAHGLLDFMLSVSALASRMAEPRGEEEQADSVDRTLATLYRSLLWTTSHLPLAQRQELVMAWLQVSQSIYNTWASTAEGRREMLRRGMLAAGSTEEGVRWWLDVSDGVPPATPTPPDLPRILREDLQRRRGREPNFAGSPAEKTILDCLRSLGEPPEGDAP